MALARIELPAATSLHVPMMRIPAALPAIDRSQPVVCICHHGVRSAHVVAFLLHHGYDDVYNLAGGIDAGSATVDARVARY